MTASEQQTKGRDAVESSARDPIADWLAVFGRTLAVPKAEAREILDELEDHLRTRVDDLLIAGLSEPEATRRAVGELGETVALAKGFREARTHRRRRLLMQAATISAAAAAVTISVWTAMAPGAGGAGGVAGGGDGAAAAMVASGRDGGASVVAVFEPDDAPLGELVIDEMALADAFELLAGSFDRTALVHWNELGLSPLGYQAAPVTLSNLTAEEAIEKLMSSSGIEWLGEVRVRMRPTVMEVGPRSHFDSAERSRREYSMGEIDLSVQIHDRQIDLAHRVL
ncbi:MAG: permease prefix domain 1-containing protein, partial [Planctomycetota bacterium]